jgi:hypothetical protein
MSKIRKTSVKLWRFDEPSKVPHTDVQVPSLHTERAVYNQATPEQGFGSAFVSSGSRPKFQRGSGSRVPIERKYIDIFHLFVIPRETTYFHIRKNGKIRGFFYNRSWIQIRNTVLSQKYAPEMYSIGHKSATFRENIFCCL